MAVVRDTPALRQAPPDTLNEQEAGIWGSIMDSLPADWFRPSDWPILAAYCQTAVQYEQATEELRGKPLTLEGAGRVYRNPLLSVQHTAALRLAALASKLRLCPNSRVRHDATGSKRMSEVPKNKPWQYGNG